MKNKVCFVHVMLSVAATLALSMFVPSVVLGQKPSCAYDHSAPTLKSARTSFRITNYECAEMELKDILSRDTLGSLAKADAHALLAAVYYAQARNENERRQMVIGEFRAVFRTYREWRGTLDIIAPEFADMMEEARRQVEQVPPKPGATGYQATPPVRAGCPSSKTPWISTAALIGSATLFVMASSKAGDKWNEYEKSAGHPENLYDSYVSASHLKQWVGGLTIAAGAVTGYLWWKYLKGKSGCSDLSGTHDHNSLWISPTPGGVALTLRF